MLHLRSNNGILAIRPCNTLCVSDCTVRANLVMRIHARPSCAGTTVSALLVPANHTAIIMYSRIRKHVH